MTQYAIATGFGGGSSGGGSDYWADAVADFASLPTGQNVGEIRQTLDNNNLFRWDGAIWQSYYDPTSGGTVPNHNDTTAKQGGTAGEYYHLTAAEHTNVQNIDQVYTSAEKTKLSGIETGAEVNQTDAEIKTQYEANADTNAFTDAEKTKLSGIETGAEVNPNAAEVKTLYESNLDTNAYDDAAKSKVDAIDQVYTSAEKTKLSGIETGAEVNQTDAEIKTQYEANANTNAFTDAEQTKLTGIEAGAEVNQTDAEIKTQYEANANTNAFTDAEQTKLSGIETGAEVNPTDSETIAAIRVQATATSALDFTNSLIQHIDIAANTTFTFTNTGDGRFINLAVSTDGTQRDTTFPGTVAWMDADEPTSVPANETWHYSFWQVDAVVYGAYRKPTA